MTGWKLNGLEVNAQLTRWFVSFAELSCVSVASVLVFHYRSQQAEYAYDGLVQLHHADEATVTCTVILRRSVES